MHQHRNSYGVYGHPHPKDAFHNNPITFSRHVLTLVDDEIQKAKKSYVYEQFGGTEEKFNEFRGNFEAARNRVYKSRKIKK